jgi:archaellum component FlaF (FlaF/FlaG flagellin family)
MAIEKQVVVDQIEVLENGVVQVRTATRIIENGEVISNSLHRHVVVPGQDYSQEDPKVRAICAAIQTPDVIAAYEAAVEAAKPAALEV